MVLAVSVYLFLLLSIKHDSVCQVIFDKPGRDRAQSQCPSVYKKSLIGIRGGKNN